MPAIMPYAYQFNNRLPKNAVVDFEIVEFGGVVRGTLGGPDQYVKRLGDRFKITVRLPTTQKELAGDWVGNRGFSYARGGVMKLILPQMMDVSDCGKPMGIMGPGTGGTYLYLDPNSAGLYKNGQLFSYFDSNSLATYLHMVTGFAIDNGYPLISIAPALRGNPIGAYLEFGDPMIEGFMTDIGFSLDQKRFVSQQFTISEWR